MTQQPDKPTRDDLDKFWSVFEAQQARKRRELEQRAQRKEQK